jgi:hypothetical protein
MLILTVAVVHSVSLDFLNMLELSSNRSRMEERIPLIQDGQCGVLTSVRAEAIVTGRPSAALCLNRW